MAYFTIEDFKAGLDVRRSKFTSVAGTLQKLVNAHITRGGDVERRKIFADKGSLRSTFGLAADINGKVTFGSAATPGGTLPTGVRYQRLQSPTGAAMTGIVDAKQYGGMLYAVADFADGTQWHFYDGVLVSHWGEGIVDDTMLNIDLIAARLRGLIDASDDYSAAGTHGTIEIVGPVGVDYTISTLTDNVDGGVDDQAMTLALIESPIAGTPAVQSAGEFAILSGSVGAGNYISAVRVDVAGVFTDLIGANVPFTTSPEYTAAAVATAINAGTGTHGYTAMANYGKVFIYASAAAGAAPNGRVVEVTAKGDIILYNGNFVITAGTASAGVNKVASVKANGLEILSVAVDWTGSNAATANAIAAQIRAFASVPKYNARAEGSAVFVSPEKVRSDDPATITLGATSAGNVLFGDKPSIAQVIAQYDDYNDSTPRHPIPGEQAI